MRRMNMNDAPEFKAKLALAGISGDKVNILEFPR